MRIGLIPMAIIPTSDYWRFRGTKIPPAFKLLGDEAPYTERGTEFYTDAEIIENTKIGQATHRNTGKYGPKYLQNRKLALRRDKYTCRMCGYKSQRRKGDVHDLEVHHVDPKGGCGTDNLQTVCLPCHHRLTANEQAD